MRGWGSRRKGEVGRAVALLLAGWATLGALATPTRSAAEDATLTWTSPGDNGASGTASIYEVRHSTVAPGSDTLAWWSAASAVPGVPPPRHAGSFESLVVNGLLPDVAHFFAVVAVDEMGNRSAVSNVAITTPPADPDSTPQDSIPDDGAPIDTIPPSITSVGVAVLSPTSVTVSWQTNERADGWVAYGVEGDLSSATPLDPALVLAHTFVLSGLAPNTTYTFQVSSRDSSENVGSAGPFPFVTPAAPDTTAPVVSALQVTSIAQSSARFLWITSEPSTGTVEYGPTAVYGFSSPSISGLSTSHEASASGLLPGTEYHFRVVVQDSLGNVAATDDVFFTTTPEPPAPGDSIAPVISQLEVLVDSPNRVRVRWATDEATTGEILYRPDGEPMASVASDTAETLEHEVVLAGLAEETRFSFQVVARDSSGNLTIAGPMAFETLSSADRTVPVVSGLAVEIHSTTEATVRWSTDEASDSQVEFGASAELGLATLLDEGLVLDHVVAIGGLLPGVTYNYRVLSRDGSGNLARSAQASFSMPANPVDPPDTLAPVITGVTSIVFGPSTVRVRWTTSEPADGQVAYGPGNERTSLSTRDENYTLAHDLLLDGLLDGTVWSFSVISRDSAGNEAASAPQSFETPSETDTMPPFVFSVEVAAITAYSAEIRWRSSEPSDRQVEYGLTAVYGFATPLDEGLARTHAVRLSGLQPETTYHFRVLSRDTSGNLARSADATFETATIGGAPPDTVPPQISNVSAELLEPTRVRIRWTTSEPGTGQIQYGLGDEYGLSSQADTEFTTEHEVILAGLAPSTAFHFRAVSEDAEGNAGVSADAHFETGADQTPPPSPVALAAEPASAGVLVSWSPSDAADLAGYRVYRSSGGAFEPLTPQPIAENSFNDAAAPGGVSEIVYAVAAVDAAGNESPWAVVTLTFAFELFPSRPNPANPGTTLRFRTPPPRDGAESHVTLIIYNMAGGVVRTLVDAPLPGGEHQVFWVGTDWRGDHVASGAYLARLSAGGISAVRKLTILR